MTGAVVVLGGTQPLGVALCARLAAEGRRVVAVGWEPDGARALPEGVAYRRVDLSDDRARGALADVVRPLGPTALVHLAFHRVGGPGRLSDREPPSPTLSERSSPSVGVALDAAGRRPGPEPSPGGLDVEATRRVLAFAEDHRSVRHFLHWSTADVYAQEVGRPYVLREDHPLELDPRAPPWVRDRVASDLTVSTRMGLATSLTITVLRCAEILAPDMGSQLLDWLGSRVCLRPMGFDPILNLLSLEDAARAFALALATPSDGAFNVRGADTLPLSWVARRWGRRVLPVPGPALGPLYALRRLVKRTQFRYGPNAARFHTNGVLDGTRAHRVLGYLPEHPLPWPFAV